MHQSLDQQNVLPPNIGLVAEENLHNLAGGTALTAAVLGLDELADYRHVDRPHQIGHKHEGIFQNRQHLDRLPLVVVGNLPAQFLDSLLNLLCADDLSKGLDSRIHEICVPPRHGAGQCSVIGLARGMSTITSAASPGFARSLAGALNPRTHTITSPLTTTGHNLRAGWAI